jgi:hypothetical protein
MEAGAAGPYVTLEGPGSTSMRLPLSSVLGRGRSGVGRAGDRKPSVSEDADRDDIKRVMLASLTGVRKRGRLVARQNARTAGGPIFSEDRPGFRIFADAEIVARCDECLRTCAWRG